MSRLRVMGAFAAPLTGASVMTPPPYAIFLEPGGVGSKTADQGLFPEQVSGEEAAKYRWLYRAWQVDITGHAPAGGSFDDETLALTVVYENMFTDELELTSPLAGDFFPVFNDGTRTLDNGVDPPLVLPWSPTTTLHVCERASDFIPPGAPDTNNYHYNTSTGLFLPRIEFEMFGTPANSFIRATNYEQEDDMNVGTSIQTFTGDWYGQPIDIQLLTANSHPLDSFTFTASPVRWWEYRDKDGNNPIWHETLGTELLNHSTPLD